MKAFSICFIGPNPEFNGGVSTLQNNLIEYIKNIKEKKYRLSWVYPGRKNREYVKEGVNYIEIRVPKIPFIEDLLFSLKASVVLNKKCFDVVNAQGTWRVWGNHPKMVNTYHGTAYHMLRNSSLRFTGLKRILFFVPEWFGYFMEKPEKNSKIICVSEKVRRQVEKLYGRKKDIAIIRTGVDLTKFRPRDSKKAREKIGLGKNNSYGLYIGRGGFWTKGLDRAIKISELIHKKKENYRLIVIGADLKKVKHLLNKKFIIYVEEVKRREMPIYYNSAEIFFCMSRYEGGAPTLVVSEAMASGCTVVCSKDSEQEIIDDGRNGMILDSFGEDGADKVVELLKNKKMRMGLVRNSLKTIKTLSLEKWGKKYVEFLEKFD